MNKKAVAAAVLVLAAFLLCGYGWRLHVRQELIETPVYSSFMRMIAEETPGGVLTEVALRSEKMRVEGIQLYHVRYYPQARTVVCTVDEVKKFPSMGARLIGENGAEISGWYLPAQIKQGVVKLFFEEVEHPDTLAFLELIDVARPDSTEAEPTIRFPLK